MKIKAEKPDFFESKNNKYSARGIYIHKYVCTVY